MSDENAQDRKDNLAEEIDFETIANMSEEEMDNLSDDAQRTLLGDTDDPDAQADLDNVLPGKEIKEENSQESEEAAEDKETVAKIEAKEEVEEKAEEKAAEEKVENAEEEEKATPAEEKVVEEAEKTDNVALIDDEFITSYSKGDDAIAQKLERFKGKPVTEVLNSYLNLEQKFSERKVEKQPEVRKEVKITDAYKEQFDGAVLTELKLKHPNLSEDYPDAFNSIEKFKEAVNDMTLVDTFLADEVKSSFTRANDSVKGDIEKIQDMHENYGKYNTKAITDGMSVIGEELTKWGVSAEELKIDLKALENNPFLDKLLVDTKTGGMDSRVAERFAEGDNGEGRYLVHQESLVHKFLLEYKDVIRESVQAKGRTEGFIKAGETKAAPSMTKTDAGKVTTDITPVEVDIFNATDEAALEQLDKAEAKIFDL